MNDQALRHRAAVPVFIVLAMALAACGAKLPPDAKEVVLRGFDPEQKVRIDSATEVDPLQEDLALGAGEVWCVNVTFVCWSCDYGEWRTCADSRLARRVDGAWEVSLVFTDEDKERWEARGCELIADVVGGY